MTHTQTQGADGAGTITAGVAKALRLADWGGVTIGNKALIAAAISELEATPASTIPPGVRSLLRTARSGLATYGAGAFEGTILQIDAILANDPIFPPRPPRRACRIACGR